MKQSFNLWFEKKLVFLNHSAVKTVKKCKYIREIVHSKHHSKLNFFSILQHYMFKKPLDFIFSIKIIRNRSAEWWWTFFLASYKLIFDTIPFFLLVAHIHKNFFTTLYNLDEGLNLKFLLMIFKKQRFLYACLLTKFMFLPWYFFYQI